MGGARAGEVASQTAVEALVELTAAGESPAAAAAEANRRIHTLAGDDEDRKGMGTTLTALVVEGEVGSVVHIGDSRLYRLRDGALDQLTSDHSMVGQWLREGTITPEEAAVSRYRSVLTRALGTEPEAEIDAFEVDLRAGDRLLLCTDGLSGLVPDETIAVILGQGSPDVAARELVREAKNRGGFDNISVVVLRLDELDLERREQSAGPAPEPRPVLPSPATPSRTGDELAAAGEGQTGRAAGATIASATTPSVMAGVVQAPAAAARSRRRHRLLMVLLVVALAVLVVAVLVLAGVVDPASLGIGAVTVIGGGVDGATSGVAP